MNLPKLPNYLREMTIAERQQALQCEVNEVLHRWNICPIGEYMAGPRTNLLHVERSKGRHWQVCETWAEDKHLVKRVVLELERRWQGRYMSA
jgi:hypothetical protein